MKKLFASLFGLIFAAHLFAADGAADFSTANKLYAEGKFADAADAYEKILATDAATPNLLFNCGNAEFKAGHLGKAIGAFRFALMRSPHDSEIRANLDFVRSKVQGASVAEISAQKWLGNLSLNEWTGITMAAFWLTFLLLAARQLRPAFLPKLKAATRMFAVLTIFSGAALALQAANHGRQTVVVIAAETTARSGPFDEAQSAFTVRDGAELSVVDRHGDWIQVTNGFGKTGWLLAKQIEILPGA